MKQLITRLSHPELRMVRAWVEQAARVRFSHLRLVITPSMSEPEDFEGSEGELAGQIRHKLHLLSEDRQRELMLWIRRRMETRQDA